MTTGITHKDIGDTLTKTEWLATDSHVMGDSLNIPASYVIFKDGSTIKAKNGTTGEVDFSGTDAAAVIQAALDNLSAGRTWKEKVVLKGNFTIVSTITIPDYTIFEVQGRLTLTDKTVTLLSIVGDDVEIRCGVYDGNRGATSADSAIRVIHISGGAADIRKNVIVDGAKVINGYSRGIEVDYGYGVFLNNIYVSNCYHNIMAWVDIDALDGLALDCFAVVNGAVLENAVATGFDATYPNLIINNIRLNNNATGMSIDGYKNAIVTNVEAEGQGLNFVTGSWTYASAVNLLLNQIRAKNLYFSFVKGANSVKMSNVILKGATSHAIQFLISGDVDVEDISLSNVEVANFAWEGLVISRSSGTGTFKRVIIGNGCSFRNTAAGHDAVMIALGEDIIIQGIVCKNNTRYDLRLENITNLLVTGNYLAGTGTGAIYKSGNTNEKIFGNLGYVTENSGTTTITSGQTSVNVTHNLAATPTRVILTPTTDTGGKRYWVSAKAASTFTITIDSSYGSDILFDWRGIVGEG